ncbi:MAG: SRPBCC family protein [Pseudomonadota bacterium]
MFSSKKIAGILIGAAYGLAFRFGLAHPDVHPVIGTISAAFLYVCPFSVGAIAVLWGAERGTQITIPRQAGMAISAMALFLLAMFVTFLEGLICIVLVVPVFMAASVVGGLVGGVVHNYGRMNRSTLPALALLPFLVGPLENLMPPQHSEQSVTNTIHITAPPEAVFDRLADVRNIKPDELGFTFVHLIGLPKPLEAQMNGSGPGSVRTSRWEKHVWFQEVITESDKPRALRYRFVVPKGAIPRAALDEHVEINGEYFELVDGGFTLEPALDGGTDLSLTTRFINKSRLKVYGNLWGSLVLKDFHRSILGLMKSRSEHQSASSSGSANRVAALAPRV